MAAADLDRLRPHLEIVELDLGRSIYEPGSELPYVYFPTTAIISILNLTQDGGSAETAVVGCEGAVSIATYLGGGTAVGRAVVQIAGMGIRVPAPVIQRDFERGRDGAPRAVALHAGAAHSDGADGGMQPTPRSRAAALPLDSLHAGSCRHARNPDTHQMIANMLGVRREGVTEAARKLKGAGVIEYRRGRVRVIDRAGLEACACECYGVVREEYDRLLG